MIAFFPDLSNIVIFKAVLHSVHPCCSLWHQEYSCCSGTAIFSASDSKPATGKILRRRRIFSSCIGSISSFFQNLITTSKEAPPISRDNRVINVLFGISVSIANGRRLIYLLRIMLRSFTHGSFRLLGDYNLDTFFFDGINLRFYALPIRDNTI